MSKKEFMRKLKSLVYLTTGGAVAYEIICYKKDFNGFYSTVLQPASQYISPEWAHNLGILAIKYGVFPAEKYKDPSVLVKLAEGWILDDCMARLGDINIRTT